MPLFRLVGQGFSLAAAVVVYFAIVSEKAIPRKNAYKAAEVCDIAHIQPYVLRSWELEFPNLGVAKAAGGARMYRPADLEQVLRIKQLVFEQGLTLAGARRQLDDEEAPQADLPLDEMTPEMRERLARVKQGLRELLALLDGTAART
ncbi:MAG: MerR family transcriptional regulator [Bacteroidales bacterium]